MRYLKNKEKQEIDFLILRNNKPFLPIEVKLTEEQPSPSWNKFMRHISCSHGIQVIMKPHIYKIHEESHHKVLTISAADFLKSLT